MKSIPKVAEYEVNRQKQLIETKNPNELKSEVRKAEADLTTSFLRPMPGSDRMYVETDVPLVKITKELLDKIELPELLASKVDNLEELYGLTPEIAREIINREINFEHYVNEFRNLDANLIGRVLIEVPKEIKSRLNLDVNKLTEANYDFVLGLLDEGKINKEAVLDVFAEIIKTGSLDLDKYKGISEKELETEIKKIIDANPNAPFGGLMGEVMKKFRGKCDGKKISDIINKLKK